MNPVKLTVMNQGHCPSFKNHKHSGANGFVYCDPRVKKRVQSIENAMLSELYSESQIVGSETHSECWKRLRTVLSGLSDDSIREIPEGSWAVEFVPPGDEGLEITIEPL